MNLFDTEPADQLPLEIKFDGETFDAEKDGERLSTQLHRVRETMLSGGWWRLCELARVVGGSEAGVSARVRDLRKLKHGAYVVQRRRAEGARGLWEYRLIVPSGAQA